MLTVTHLHATSMALRHRAEHVLHKVVINFSRAWRSHSRASTSNEKLAGVIRVLVLCAILFLVMLAVSSVQNQVPSEGRPTTTEREALNNIFYGRQR
jgi:hypothetical protein